MAEQTKVKMKCLRCGHEFEGVHDPDTERMCPKCRSNSVRVVNQNDSGRSPQAILVTPF